MVASSRVLLVAPSGGVRTQIPYLNLYYLAAALRRSNVDVRLLDLGSMDTYQGQLSLLRSWIDGWEPTLLGVNLCSETALPGYRLLADLGQRDNMTVVAGGPHATVLPGEPLVRGFDIVVRGEGEATLVELAQALASNSGIESVSGISYRGAGGHIQHNEARLRLSELDDLASPTEVFDLLTDTELNPTVLTSRGCPSRCTFCANQVFGHSYRFHSEERVLREMEAWHARNGSTVFNFCDAAFTVHRKRLRKLCKAMATLSFEPEWWCEARCDQLDDESARLMAEAGCKTVLLGAESGDPDVLNRIGKGIGPDDIVRALETAKRHGLRTEVSFMLGFPNETPIEIRRTLAFMEQVADLVDVLRPLGIVMPYPGTALYEQYHEEGGFTGWWLDEVRHDRLRALMTGLQAQHYDHVVEMHAAAEEALLEVHPISYLPEVHDAIRECLAFRREHNRQRLSSGSPARPEPADSDGTGAAHPTSQTTAVGRLVDLDADQASAANAQRRALLDAMEGRVEQSFGGSKPHIGPISPGCQLCGEGRWSCLFVNALCNGSCFFCPTDMTYKDVPPTAELVPFESPDDYAAYVEKLGFKGVGLSGGEPFLTFEKTLAFLRALRSRLADSVYIWAYTNGISADSARMEQLAEAGLDELRFNLVASDYSLDRIAAAVGVFPRVTVEIPVVPEDIDRLKALLPRLKALGIAHVNLHQLMIVGQNAPRLQGRGYTFLWGPAPGVMESELTALELLRFALDKGIGLPINYCGLAYKGRWQNQTQDLRAAEIVTEAHESRTPSGLLRRIWLDVPPEQARELARTFGEEGLNQGRFVYDESEGRLFVNPALAGEATLEPHRFLAQYFKTLFGPQPADGGSSNSRQVEVSPTLSVPIGLHPVGPAVSLSASEVSGIAIGEPPHQIAGFELVPSGLPDYF